MAVIARRVKRFKGTVTTDAAGAAAVDVVFGAAGGVALPSGTPGYKLTKVSISQDGANPLTGGTINIRDNSGAGAAVNHTITIPTDLAAAGGASVIRTFNAPAVVTNVRFTVAGGGNTKSFNYTMTFARTRGH